MKLCTFKWTIKDNDHSETNDSTKSKLKNRITFKKHSQKPLMEESERQWTEKQKCTKKRKAKGWDCPEVVH